MRICLLFILRRYVLLFDAVYTANSSRENVAILNLLMCMVLSKIHVARKTTASVKIKLIIIKRVHLICYVVRFPEETEVTAISVISRVLFCC